jgi:hypothetical protein
MTTEVQRTTPAPLGRVPWPNCIPCGGTGVVEYPEIGKVACKCPRGPKRKFKRVCAECGESFMAAKADAVFCPKVKAGEDGANRPRDCKTAYHNRSMYRGKTIMPPLLAWRAGRNYRGDSAERVAAREVGKSAFAEMCRLADKFNAEDKAAGRQPAFKFYRRQLGSYLRETH